MDNINVAASASASASAWKLISHNNTITTYNNNDNSLRTY